MNTTDIIDRIESVIGPREAFTPLHIPIFDEREVELLRECVESNMVSSVGAFGNRFEAALADYTGAKRVVLCVNGTSALHLALRVTGVQPGDEVMLPSLSFVATANAVRYAGAVPHFVDVREAHFGMDPAALQSRLEAIGEQRDGGLFNRETGRPIRCVVPMHAFGHPVLISELLAVAKRFGLALVEDAAESLGSFYEGRHTGTFGDCGTLSFNGNKVITTGGGGALLFNDDALADRAKYLSTTAKRPHKWEFFHDELGYNYRMPALNAAMGCAQMEKLSGMLKQKRALAARYAEAFADLDGVRFVTEPPGCQSNYWLNALVLQSDSIETRNAILDATNAGNIMTRPIWTPLHALPMYADCPRGTLDVTRSLAKRIINIPSTAGLGR
ncbi:MAG: LegC family aminotransferase [Verrucomicrobia bacterium]|jgi:perosamine synthetase|nr:LegC family aminotransferase [Verrucomicrobiota bacterium]